MRVLLFTETRIWGGLEVHAVALSGVLAQEGVDVTLACIGSATYELYRCRVPSPVNVVRVEPPARRTVAGWRRSLRHLEADAAVLEKGTLATGGLALDVALRLRYRRYVTIMQLEPAPLLPRSSTRHLGGLVPGIGAWWYRQKWTGMARSWAPQTTVCVSDAIGMRLAADYGFAPRKLVTVHNGVDVAVFRPQPELRAPIRRQWGVPADAFVFGSAGRLSEQKGLDVGIEAFARVVAARPDLPLFLVWAGEGAERAALEDLARRLRVDDRVRFPGFVERPAEFYQGLDVFLIPSRYRGAAVRPGGGAGFWMPGRRHDGRRHS